MRERQKYHAQQHDLSDCGVACLLTIVRSFGGNIPLSQLREWSGTSLTGSTMLGLQLAAQKAGIEAEGFEAEVSDLKSLQFPAILHVTNLRGLFHFVVCFGYDFVSDSFEISDPAEDHITAVPSQALESVWSSKTLLVLKPTPLLKPVALENSSFSQLKWLYRFAKPDINILFISFALGVFVSVLGLSVAVFTQKLVDHILPDQNLIKLLAGSGLLLFLLLLRSVFQYIRQLFLLRQNQAFNLRILSSFYSSLLYLPKSFFDSRKTGELISRMNDTTRIQQTVANVFTNFTLEIVVVAISVAGLFYYHPGLGWIALLWLPLFAWMVYRFQRSVIDSQRNVMVTASLNESNYIDTIQGAGIIKVFNKESLFINQTKTIYNFLQDRIFQLGLISNRFNVLAQIISSFFVVGLIFYGSWLVIQGSLTIGVVMAVIQLISMTMLSASHIAMINISLQEAKVALERMREFSELSPEYDLQIEDEKRILERLDSLSLDHISFRYIGRPLLFTDISLEVRRGEIIVIQGESGGGKSTLLQIIQRFYDPEQGVILVNGEPLIAYAMPAWRKLLGVVPQQIKLFNRNLIENILLCPPDESSLTALVLFLKKYDLDVFFENFPNGYNTLLGEDGVNISGGQQQLVGLARALYHQPQLLLLDEATAAMDHNTEQKIFDLLTRLKAEMGIIIISHREKTATIADRVYVMEDGKMKLL